MVGVIKSAVAGAFLLGMATAAMAVTGEFGNRCTASSAVIMSPCRQTKPLDREPPENTDARLVAVPAMRPTSASDKSFRWVNELDLFIRRPFGGFVP
jgi:hypothetical protein